MDYQHSGSTCCLARLNECQDLDTTLWFLTSEQKFICLKTYQCKYSWICLNTESPGASGSIQSSLRRVFKDN